MLTRRDQLKLKEEKKNKKKEEAEQKKLQKQEEAEKKKIEKAEKKTSAKAKAGAKAKAKAKSQPEEETEKPEPEKTKRKRGGEVKEKEDEKEVVEPKAKAKRSKKETHPETEEPEPEKAAPKAKAKGAPKRKAKAKSAPKSAAAQPSKEEESEDSPTTPRRKLFQSDDEGDDGVKAQPERIDPKTGKPLKEIVEEFMPKLWNKSRPRAKEEKTDIENGDEGQVPKRRRRAKTAEKAEPAGKNGAKPTLSPFAKKEVKRRRKAEEAHMKSELEEDETMQGICTQHFKKVKALDYDGLKSYLTQNVENKIKGYYINAYWGKPATGVKCLLLGDGTLKKAPEIAYFGRYGTASGWNINMTGTYISASLLVSQLRRWFLGTGWCPNFFSCFKSKNYSIRSTSCIIPLHIF